MQPSHLFQSHLLCVDAFGHGPCGDDVVHHSLTEAFGHLVELEEIPHVIQHFVVTVGVCIHLLENGRHITEDSGIKESYRTRGEEKRIMSGRFEMRKNTKAFMYNALEKEF